MPIIRSADLSASEPFPGVSSIPILTKDGSSHNLTVLLITISPGERIPLHYHPDHDEGMYVMEGNLEATLGPETQSVETGDAVLATTGTPHQMANLSQKPAVIMAIFPTSEVKRVLL